MEAIVLEDSPLSLYLEGEGESNPRQNSPRRIEAEHLPANISFAPSAPSLKLLIGGRPGRPASHVANPTAQLLVARVRRLCMSVMQFGQGWVTDASFLEQFRYVIIASQLLSDRPNHASTKSFPLPDPRQPFELKSARESSSHPVATPAGLLVTFSLAFLGVVCSRWIIKGFMPTATILQLVLRAALLALLLVAMYLYLERQRLQNLRLRAMDTCSQLVADMHEFDIVVSSSIKLVQEVELVSRGYSISWPMPPVSRIEGISPAKQCLRLRCAICQVINSMFKPFGQAYSILNKYTALPDLEKYFDIYEIGRDDVEAMDHGAYSGYQNLKASDSLHDIRSGLETLNAGRKMLLCALLALDARGRKEEYRKWSSAVDLMMVLSSTIAKEASALYLILEDREDETPSKTPMGNIASSDEQANRRLRKIRDLSLMLRSIQAKTHLLYEGHNPASSKTGDDHECELELADQYESIDRDVREFLQEWEQSRSVLTFSEDGIGNSRTASTRLSVPLSPTSSLSGATAIEGSPQDALSALNGRPRSASSTSVASSASDEHILEAVAVPHQRSTSSREARITKTKEDRKKEMLVKEKAQATTRMLKELETVIKQRPRGRTTGRLTSI